MGELVGRPPGIWTQGGGTNVNNGLCRLLKSSAGHAPTLYVIRWHLPYNWRTKRKTSVKVSEIMAV